MDLSPRRLVCEQLTAAERSHQEVSSRLEAVETAAAAAAVQSSTRIDSMTLRLHKAESGFEEEKRLRSELTVAHARFIDQVL
jgi:hypothetical protein